MSKDSCSCLHACSFFDCLCKIHRITNTFCIDDNVVLLTSFFRLFYIIDNILNIISFFLRKENTFSSICNTAPQSQVSCITSHNFNNRTSAVWSRSITDFINCLHSCIYRCVKSDRILCTINIKIDGSRNSNRIHSKICKFLRSTERSVSSNYYQTVNSILFTDSCCFLLTFFCNHLFTTGRLKNCTSTLNNVWYISCIQIDDFLIEKSLITFSDASYFHTFSKCSSDNSTNCRVHSRSISSTCQYTYCTNDSFCHDSSPPS